MLVAGALIDMGLGTLLLVAGATAARPLALATAVGTAMIVTLTATTAPFSPRLLASGVYRTGNVAEKRQMVFYSDGRTASVSAVRDAESGYLAISTNGKVDASLGPEWFRRCDGTSKP